MKFTLTARDINKLMQFAKYYIDSDGTSSALNLIQCEVNDRRIKANCIERTRLCEITLPVEDFDGEAGKCFLFPVNKRFLNKDGNVEITVEKDTVIYKNKVSSQIFKVNQSQEMFDTRRIWEGKTKTKNISQIYFFPNQLIQALQPFKDGYYDYTICIDIINQECFIITQNDGDCSYKALVLAAKKS